MIALSASAFAVAAVPEIASASPEADAFVARVDPGIDYRRGGLQLDVGAPDGLTVAAVLRPTSAFRFDVGVSYNGISHGVRGGITFAPFATWFSPTLSFHYGHYADGDANPLARAVMGDPTFSSPALDHVGYEYADTQLGLEFGRKHFTFFIHAGASLVTGNVHELDAVVSGQAMSSTTTIAFVQDPSVTVISVSARVGFILYFAK